MKFVEVMAVGNDRALRLVGESLCHAGKPVLSRTRSFCLSSVGDVSTTGTEAWR
ncbi:MAG: hypothetical protein ACP5QR_01875 [Rhizomicrobium sp.]